jgi:hypothetical protein
MNWFKRLRYWKNQPLSFEQWQYAYQLGRYDEAQEWREIVKRTHLQYQQAQATGSMPQTTAPLYSIRTIAAVAQKRRSLKTVKLEPLPDIETQRLKSVRLDDIANYQNSFRNVQN